MSRQLDLHLGLDDIPETFLRAAYSRCRIHAPFDKAIQNRGIYLCLRNVALAMWKKGGKAMLRNPKDHERVEVGERHPYFHGEHGEVMGMMDGSTAIVHLDPSDRYKQGANALIGVPFLEAEHEHAG